MKIIYYLCPRQTEIATSPGPTDGRREVRDLDGARNGATTRRRLNTKKLKKMKNVKETAVITANVETTNVETTNVETTNVTENVSAFVDAETMTKAAAILRARLPHLSAANLNFEKRTGSFFVARIESTDGIEKVRREVIADADISETCADEMRAKRAAAFVRRFDAEAEKAETAIAEAREALAAAEAHKVAIFDRLAEAIQVCEGCELPEKAARETLAAKVEKQSDEIAKLRALLLAAGINPDGE